MSTIKTNAVQIGQSVTATNNFTLSQPAVPDGTMKLARGNVGSTTQDILTVGTDGNVTMNLSGVVINNGYTEEVFSVTGTTPALSPTNGSIQTWTLSGASTPTLGTWAEGQNITLMVDDGSASSITWTSVAPVWKTNNGTAPTLQTTGYTVIQLWKVGTTIYGARVGDA